jgi:hypothetical protein
MKLALALSAIAAFAPTAALAQQDEAPAQAAAPTRSFEGENVEASKSASYDQETRTLTREASATNKNNGNTVTRKQQRQFTENGSTYTGQITGPNGQTFGLEGQRFRDGEGNSGANQSFRRNGEIVGTRSRTTNRSTEGVSHSIKRSGRSGIRRRRN